MFNNNIQYINLITTEQNIKIDYQIIQDKKVSKSEQSIFLLEDGNISSHALIKIKSLEDSVPTTYITALCEDENQNIITKDYVCNNTQTAVLYDTSHNIVLDNKQILSSKNFYNNGEIDYLLSPFSILHHCINENLNAKSINILIFNNKMYSIILDEQKRLSYSSINILSPYNNINESNFFEDEITKQKFYEEMYLLELQDTISNITSDFYEKNNSPYFVESVNIYYSLKQLNTQQIQSLNEALMIDINYQFVNIENVLHKLIQKQQIKNYSFINLRKKKKKLSLLSLLGSIAVITTILAVFVFYYKSSIIQEEPIKEIKRGKEIKVIKEIALPLHNNINELKTKFIIKLFDSISSDAVLKEIQIQNNESTLVYSYINKNSYELNLKPQMLKLYKNSQNVLSTNKKGIFTSIISNTNNKEKINSIETKLYKPSKEFRFLSKKDAKKYLSKLLSNNNITNKSNSIKKYTSYIFDISKNIKSPQDFYNDIEKINKQYYSIELIYPIEFIKTNEALLLNYSLRFNQINQENSK